MKKVKPVCFGHKQLLYIIIVGEKSIAYDYKSHKIYNFPLMNYHIANTNDLKPVVLNDKDLFIFQSSKWCSKARN